MSDLNEYSIAIQIIRDIALVLIAIHGLDTLNKWRSLQIGKDRYSKALKIGDKVNNLVEKITQARIVTFPVFGREDEIRNIISDLDSVNITSQAKANFARLSTKIQIVLEAFHELTRYSKSGELIGLDVSKEIQEFREIIYELNRAAPQAYISDDHKLVEMAKQKVVKSSLDKPDKMQERIENARGKFIDKLTKYTQG